MLTQIATVRNTFVICCLTCLAYEGTRINGYYNRHSASSGYSDSGFYEIAVNRWQLQGLWVYMLIFLFIAVVAANKFNPKIKATWFWFSFIALIVICLCIPGAYDGRWAGTDDFVAAFYLFIVPLPATIFIAYGIYTHNANKRMQSDRPTARR